MPPPLEIDCLKVLWTIGEANVKTVQQALGRDLAYTTVMTLLDRLARRGGAVRRKVGRGFVYTPVLTRDALRRVAVERLVGCFFDGSPDALIEYLRGSATGNGIPNTAAAVAASDIHLDTALL